MPLPRTRKLVPGCVPFGNVERMRAVECRHVDGAAERQRGELHRHLAVQVVALTVEVRVVGDVEDDVEVALGTAAGAVFALAAEPHPLARRDACRNA